MEGGPRTEIERGEGISYHTNSADSGNLGLEKKMQIFEQPGY